VSQSTIFNPELVGIAKHQVEKAAGQRPTFVLAPAKQAFVDPMAAGGGDPAMGGMPPPAADPMMGAMPPMPGMGADPMAAGGSAMGPGGVEERLAKLEAGGAAGGAAGEDGMKKPKVDVNTEIYHIKKMLAKLLSSMGIQMDATDMLGDPAEDPEVPPEEAAQDPFSAASQQSSIGAIGPVEGASPAMMGGGGGGAPAGGAPKAAGAGLQTMTDKAAALTSVLRRAHAG